MKTMTRTRTKRRATFDGLGRWARLFGLVGAASGISGALALGSGCDGGTARSGANPSVTGADGGGADVLATTSCEEAAPGPVDLIDDMEDGDNATLVRAGRRGYWYTYHDETAGQMTPDQGTSVSMEPIPGTRCGSSNFAMRVTGSGFMNWGAGFGFDLKSDNSVYFHTLYDGSATQGVTFWARVGDASVQTIRLDVNDQWSDPVGGTCDVSVMVGPTACYDAFGADIRVTTTWKRYSRTWDELGQRNFGVVRPRLDTAALTQIHFDIGPSAPVFDVWIDDVAFF